MEMDKRVGDYAAAMVRDVDLLLENAAGMNGEQYEMLTHLKRNTDLFLSLYNQHKADFIELTIASRVYAFDMRSPLSNIGGFCGWLLEDYALATPAELQLLTQIKTAQEIIDNAYAIWVTQYPFPPE